MTKKIGEIYSQRQLTCRYPEPTKKHPEGRYPCSNIYWDIIKDMTVKEYFKVLYGDGGLSSLERKGKKWRNLWNLRRVLYSERKVTFRVIDRLCKDGLHDRRSSKDRRISNSNS